MVRLRSCTWLAVVATLACTTDFPELRPGAGGSLGGAGAAGVGAAGGSQVGGSGGIAGGGGAVGGSSGSAAGGSSGSATGGSSGSAGGGAAGSAGTGGSAGAAPSGLIGYWPLEDKAGTKATDQVGFHDGVLAPSKVTWTSQGKVGSALEFADGEGLVMNTLSGSAFPTAGTLSMWLRADFESPPAKHRNIFDKADATRDHIYLRRSKLDTGAIDLQAHFQKSDGSWAFLGSHKVKVKTWQHVAVGWDVPAKAGFYYLEGNLETVDFSKHPNWTPKDQEFRFGRLLIGTIDEIRLYNRMLSLAEIQLVAQLNGP